MVALTDEQVRVRIAKMVAQLLPDNAYVNLGVGIPTLACNYLPHGKSLNIQTENGMLGVGPAPTTDDAIDRNLINASRKFITRTPGCSFFDSAASFAMIRSGRLDVTVIGAIEVSERGDLANWALPGKGVLGPGGAMDLVIGAKEVMVATSHVAKNGKPKLVPKCTLPLTGLGVVTSIVTEFAVFRFTEQGMCLEAITSDVSLEEIAHMTTAKYYVSTNLNVLEV